MNYFKTLLKEVFDSPIDYTIENDRGKIIYTFNIRDNVITCVFDDHNDEIHSIDFYINGRSERFGNTMDRRDVMVMFSTLQNIVINFVNNNHTKGLAFWGVGRSRKKLYKRFAKSIADYYNGYISKDGIYTIINI